MHDPVLERELIGVVYFPPQHFVVLADFCSAAEELGVRLCSEVTQELRIKFQIRESVVHQAGAVAG